VEAAMAAAQGNLHRELDRFLDNTLTFARREKQLLTGRPALPPLRAALAGRQVLVVARGDGYREDLRTILHYVREQRPVLIGVDGGADALLEVGLAPDVVLGDMDSVSDGALAAARQRIVHAYPDGAAPGLARVRALGLDAEVFAVVGTSEDAALLLAYEAGADLIVAVGTHSHVIDFLEKGRPGMASTLLTRLKVGGKLVDAKGVRLLYRGGSSSYVPHLAAAGLMAAAAVLLAAPLTRGLLRLAWLELRYALGF
ncbi:MAG TPA: putative cytokinetic ring protein SteA, partial [Bacillota bacterium]